MSFLSRVTATAALVGSAGIISAAPATETPAPDKPGSAPVFIINSGKSGDACVFTQINKTSPIIGAIAFQQTVRDGDWTINRGDTVLALRRNSGDEVKFVVHPGPHDEGNKIAVSFLPNTPAAAQADVGVAVAMNPGLFKAAAEKVQALCSKQFEPVITREAMRAVPVQQARLG